MLSNVAVTSSRAARRNGLHGAVVSCSCCQARSKSSPEAQRLPRLRRRLGGPLPLSLQSLQPCLTGPHLMKVLQPLSQLEPSGGVEQPVQPVANAASRHLPRHYLPRLTVPFARGDSASLASHRHPSPPTLSLCCSRMKMSPASTDRNEPLGKSRRMRRGSAVEEDRRG